MYSIVNVANIIINFLSIPFHYDHYENVRHFVHHAPGQPSFHHGRSRSLEQQALLNRNLPKIQRLLSPLPAVG